MYASFYITMGTTAIRSWAEMPAELKVMVMHLCCRYTIPTRVGACGSVLGIAASILLPFGLFVHAGWIHAVGALNPRLYASKHTGAWQGPW